MDAVMAKGGNEANKYVYSPPAKSFGDLNLVAPGGKGVSHISFCYNSVPTATHLGTVSAVRRPRAIRLKWQTVSELDVVGLNIWRSNRKEGTYSRVNPTLLAAAKPGTLHGAEYVHKDKTAPPKKKQFYKIEIVGTQGTLEWSDPVLVPRSVKP
jgi:hypothetical protein